MMAPAVVSVVPLEPYVVRVTFGDGELRDVDIEPLLDAPVFAPLRDRDEFTITFASSPATFVDRED